MQKKTKISAVICELNPLHFGHEALFRHAKETSGGLVCILSGNFVQRGEPAILDKWARTRLALESGADLVVELPLPWACAGAERFAAGGVALANALGNVDTLVFGSEAGDEPLFRKTAEALLSPEFSRRLAALPDSGDTFARRRETVLAELLGEEVLPVLRSPNAILGVEYEKALLASGSSIRPEIFPRQGAGHDRPAGEGEFLSASDLRRRLRNGEDLTGLVPETTVSVLRELQAQGRCPVDVSLLERSILCKLRTMTAEDFSRLPDISEGLENRMYEAAQKTCTLEELINYVKSKRYTHARVRRLALHAFLGVTADLPALPPYIRVLGRTETGERILKEAAPKLPLAVRPAEFRKLPPEAQNLFCLEARADDLYALAQPVPAPCCRDCTEPLIVK